MPFAINKLHRSAYLCTPSGNPLVQFVHSELFYLSQSETLKKSEAKNGKILRVYTNVGNTIYTIYAVFPIFIDFLSKKVYNFYDRFKIHL